MPDSTVSRSVCPVCDFRIIIRETQPHERRLIEAKNAAGSDLGSDHCVAVWLGTKIIGWGDDYGTFHPSQSERSSQATDSCMSPYCTEPATAHVRRYGVDQVLCEHHAAEPITCPKCGCSSPCSNYGPGCP